MDGVTVGVFGTDQAAKSAIETALAKKSEAEGIVVHHRSEAGRHLSFLDTADYPEKIQGYARIASLSDHAFFLYPTSGKLSPSDGELAVLLQAFGLPGTLEVLDGIATPEEARSAFRGTSVADYPVDERASGSGVLSLGEIRPRQGLPQEGTIVYLDRVFPVKGVGTVALGFVLVGRVAVHDELVPIPGSPEVRAEVKGIQINDEDFQEAGRGIRVGLSLRGATAQDLAKSPWLASPGFPRSSEVALSFQRSPFYKQEVSGRELHIQLLGALLPAKIGPAESGTIRAALPSEVPAWNGMNTGIIDLNGRPLRIAGGGTCIL